MSVLNVVCPPLVPLTLLILLVNTLTILKRAIDLEKSEDLLAAAAAYREISVALGNPLWMQIKIKRLESLLLDIPAPTQHIESQSISSVAEPIQFIDSTIDDNTINKSYRPSSIPSDFIYPTQVRKINDYSFIEPEKSIKDSSLSCTFSVIIPVFERREHLSRTLACLARQFIDKSTFEVIVVDDGSTSNYLDILLKYEKLLDIRFGRQSRQGYRPGAARNLGASMAVNDVLFFLDSDILLPPTFLRAVQKWHVSGEKVITLGTRHFVNCARVSDDDILMGRCSLDNLPKIKSENPHFDKWQRNGVTYDWREDVYSASRNLKDHIFPFLCLGAGHFSVDRAGFEAIGGFDEEFCDWGGEDIELGYRLYNHGYYFIPILDPYDFHQEPLSGSNETDRVIGYEHSKVLLAEKCPAPFSRSPLVSAQNNKPFTIPKVSIYVPAFNAEATICRCVDSVLAQDYTDIEVCICDDGSTDGTLKVLENNYLNNPRVRWVSNTNGGISKASNAALSMCNGMYIGQLDSDDQLLPGVISELVRIFDSIGIGLAYTDYEIIDSKKEGVQTGWSRNEFSPYIQLIGNVICHFRFFRRRSLALTGWFDENLTSAVDFDFYTRMTERVITEKVPFLGYRYYLHAENTSRRGILEQRNNHLRVIEKTLARIGADDKWLACAPNPLRPREYHIRQKGKIYNDPIQWMPIPENFPFPPLNGVANDYNFIEEKRNKSLAVGQNLLPVSVVIPVYNRCQRLANALAGLVNQSYPIDLIEVVVTDDGSTDAIIDTIKKYEKYLNIKYVRQPDFGFRVGHARNLGVRAASNECIVGLDCDLIPCPDFVLKFMEYLNVSDQVLCLGQYKFINANHLSDDDFLNDPELLTNLPEIMTENTVVRGKAHVTGPTKDWRLAIYEQTNNLKEDAHPYRASAGGQVAFHKSLYNRAGGYDEDFNAWGCEDNEFGFRMYEAGAYLIPVLDAIDYHQEPPNGKNETDREESWKITRPLLQKKCPPFRGWFGQPWILSDTDTPKVSIYIPTLNNARYLVAAVNSCLTQSYKDLEVCILDSGSTDDTLAVLDKNFSKNPRVRWAYRKCATVTEARHYALKMCRGMYVGQLDSDDLLKPSAVETLVKVLEADRKISLAYSRYEKIDSNGNLIGPGWDSGDYSRRLLMTSMIAHHFRMFRRRAWILAGGFKDNELKKFTYAEDFLMALRLSMFGELKSVPQVLYQYRVHESNTTHSNDQVRQGALTREAASIVIQQMGLAESVTVISPYPDKPGIVGYIIDGIDN